jgi:hypothetical protein
MTGIFVRFQVLMVVSMKMTAFWDVAPCSLMEADQCFMGEYCLHHLGDEYTRLKHWSTSMRLHSAISHKAVIFDWNSDRSSAYVHILILDSRLLLNPKDKNNVILEQQEMMVRESLHTPATLSHKKIFSIHWTGMSIVTNKLTRKCDRFHCPQTRSHIKGDL